MASDPTNLQTIIASTYTPSSDRARTSRSHTNSSATPPDLDLESGPNPDLEPRWPDREARVPSPPTLGSAEETGEGLRVTVPAGATGSSAAAAAETSTSRSATSGRGADPGGSRLRAWEVERLVKFKIVGQVCTILALIASNFVILRASQESAGVRFQTALEVFLWLSVATNIVSGVLLLAQFLAPVRRKTSGAPAKEWHLWSPGTWQATEETVFHWQRKINHTITLLAFLSTILNLLVTGFGPREFAA